MECYRTTKREFAEVEQRIERVCSPAWFHGDDARFLAEIADVLALGYVSALQADARCRRLAQRIERLVSDLDHPDGCDQMRRLAWERGAIVDATRHLRARLGMVRALFTHVSARVDQTSPRRTA